jgi:hypothetical protein
VVVGPQLRAQQRRVRPARVLQVQQVRWLVVWGGRLCGGAEGEARDVGSS